MKVIQGLEAVDNSTQGCVLTIGNFDGVHRAHQALLKKARELADSISRPVVVLTFDPHPLSVVAPQRAPTPLQPLRERLRCLAESGVDVTVVARSEPNLLRLEAEEFVENVILCVFQPRHIVEGTSFGFGRGRRGNVELLQQLLRASGCRVHIVSAVTVALSQGRHEMVSSSLIRNLLFHGEVENAAACLGRPYTLIGIVGRGDGRGRRIGFPTANLNVDAQVLPADGVYAGRASFTAIVRPCAVNVGPAPTFGITRRLVEVHVLDYEGSLYGTELRVELSAMLRKQTTFPSPEELVKQLTRDVEAVRSLNGLCSAPTSMSPNQTPQGRNPNTQTVPNKPLKSHE